MKTVFVLQHSYEVNGNEETKFIGVYSTQEDAGDAVNRLKELPGFRDRPESFYINEYELNKDHWAEGFGVTTTIQVRKKDNSWMTVQAESLSDKTYRIIELNDNESSGEFKHPDIVSCEERDGDLFAVKRVSGVIPDTNNV